MQSVDAIEVAVQSFPIGYLVKVASSLDFCNYGGQMFKKFLIASKSIIYIIDFIILNVFTFIIADYLHFFETWIHFFDGQSSLLDSDENSVDLLSN